VDVPGLLPALVTCFAAGVVAADLGVAPTARGCSALALLAAGAAVGLRRRPRRRRAVVAAAFLALGALHLASRLEEARRHRPAQPRSATLEARVEATASGRSAAGGRWLAVELSDAVATEPGAPPVPSRVRVFAGAGEPEEPVLAALRPGDRLRARLRLGPPRARANPGSRPGERRAARRGVGAWGRLAHPDLLALLDKAPPADGVRPGLRARVARRLEASGSGGPLLAALAVGERSGLQPHTRRAFQHLGLGHLLAVSGLHLALAGGAAYGLLRAVLARVSPLARRHDVRGPALWGALGMAALYAGATGWGVPVRRAWLFLAVLVAGRSAGRRAAGPELLAAAGLAVLVAAPSALFEPGAQLSFAASAALLASRPRAPGEAAAAEGGVVRRLVRGASELLRASAAAVAATAPVLAAHGARPGAVGLVANLLGVPWTGAALLPAALVAGAAAAVAELAPGLPGARSVVGLAERLAAGTGAAVRAAASPLPPSPAAEAWALPAPALPVLVAAAGLAVAVARARGTALRVVGAAATAGLLAWAPRPSPGPPPPRLVVLDVGQGDAVLVQGRRGALLVDAGRAIPGRSDLGRSAVLPALAALGVQRLDVLAVSHADLDHRGGVPSVLGSLPVGELWLPAGGGRHPDLADVRAAARRAGVPWRERAAGDAAVRLGDLRVEILWPPRERRGEGLATAAEGRAARRNDRSLVLRVAAGDRRVLLPGDLERSGEAALLAGGVDLRAEVLKLGHHGSADASSPEFLEAVAPRLAVVSAGCRTAAGLPSPRVLASLRGRGARVLWTGRDGAVLVPLSGPLAVRPWREAPACPTRPRAP